MPGIPWIFCHAVRRSLGRASHGKLIHVRLAEDDRSCLFQIKDRQKGVEKYGLEILGIVRKYMKENKLERPEIFTSVSGGEDVREQKLDAQHHEDKEKQKEKKKDSKLVSYEMFCQGMTIEEIAKTRDLVTGTIAAHLEHYLREDKIKLEQVVTADKIKKVRTYLETHEFMGVVAIKAALGDEVSYADIRFVLATAGH